MNKNNQIEEMRKEVARIHRFFLEDDDYESLDEYIADMLYNAGYRKTADVAREIFEEIETSLMIESFHGSDIYYAIRAEDFHHYKKKYTEDGK